MDRLKDCFQPVQEIFRPLCTGISPSFCIFLVSDSSKFGYHDRLPVIMGADYIDLASRWPKLHHIFHGFISFFQDILICPIIMDGADIGADMFPSIVGTNRTSVIQRFCDMVHSVCVFLLEVIVVITRVYMI